MRGHPAEIPPRRRAFMSFREGCIEYRHNPRINQLLDELERSFDPNMLRVDLGRSVCRSSTSASSCVGVRLADIDRVFEPFVQIDPHLTNSRQGIGLGLSISRELARSMRGDVTVQSTHGAGSTFTLSLPIA